MDYPGKFAIETVLGCNLRCVECAVGSELVQRKHGVMSYERYLAVMEKISAHASYIYLHRWGEPMLNPDIYAMIAHASRTCRTNISTNGVLMDDAAAKKLITSGVSEIIVSIDGMTQAVYEKYRRNGDVRKALSSLVHLVKYNRLYGDRVDISPQFIVFEHNRHQMREFSEMCGKLGLRPIFKAPYLRGTSRLKASGIPGLVRVKAERPQERRDAMKSCGVDTVTNILLDGSVVPCCYDHNAEMTFGNIFRESLEDIWDKATYVAFRDAVVTGNAPLFCMKNCLMD